MKIVVNAVWRYIKQIDRVLLVLTLLAASYGLLMVYSTNLYLQKSKPVFMQLIGILVGITGMVILSKIDYHVYSSIWKYLAAAGITLIVVTLILGTGTKARQDNVAWLILPGGMSVQPAEYVKLIFIVTFSVHIDIVKENIDRLINVVFLGIHGVIAIGLVMATGDMGTGFVFIFIFMAMMFAANVKLRYFAAGAIVTLISAPFIWNHVFKELHRRRFLALFNPLKYASKEAFQQIQGRIAIGSGELWGFGLFHGPKTQSTFSQALPERQNDFIFAATGEELGFIGTILIILILLAVLIRILYVSRKSKDFLGSVLCVGVFAMFAIQMVANIGMCLFLAPVIGITLPFFSSGGTSVMASLFGIGLVLSVYMQKKNRLFLDQNDS